MAQLYDGDDDPLDGVINALQGIDKGVQNYNQGTRLNIEQARRDRLEQEAIKDRRARIYLAAQRNNQLAEESKAKIAESNQKAKTFEADRAGAASVMKSRYGGVNTGQVGPTPSGRSVQMDQSALDPEIADSFNGLEPLLQDMSPEAIRKATDDFGEHTKELQFSKSRDNLLSEVSALGAPVDETGAALPQEPGGHGTDMLGGWMDPKDVADFTSELKGAKTPADLDRVQERVRKRQSERVDEVTLGEFKANALPEFDTMFADAEAMNARRVEMGMDDMGQDIMAARKRMHDLYMPGRKSLTSEKFFSEKNAIRDDVKRISVGGGSKSSKTEKPPLQSAHENAMDLLKTLDPEDFPNKPDGKPMSRIEMYDILHAKFMQQEAVSRQDPRKDYGGMLAPTGGVRPPSSQAGQAPASTLPQGGGIGAGLEPDPVAPQQAMAPQAGGGAPVPAQGGVQAVLAEAEQMKAAGQFMPFDVFAAKIRATQGGSAAPPPPPPGAKFVEKPSTYTPPGRGQQTLRSGDTSESARETLLELSSQVAKMAKASRNTKSSIAGQAVRPEALENRKHSFETARTELERALAEYEAAFGDVPDDIMAVISKALRQ